MTASLSLPRYLRQTSLATVVLLGALCTSAQASQPRPPSYSRWLRSGIRKIATGSGMAFKKAKDATYDALNPSKYGGKYASIFSQEERRVIERELGAGAIRAGAGTSIRKWVARGIYVSSAVAAIGSFGMAGAMAMGTMDPLVTSTAIQDVGAIIDVAGAGWTAASGVFASATTWLGWDAAGRAKMKQRVSKLAAVSGLEKMWRAAKKDRDAKNAKKPN